MSVKVCYLSYHQPEITTRGYWGHAVMDGILERRVWRPVDGITYEAVEDLAAVRDGEGAIVVVPAEHHRLDAGRLNADLARLDWVLLILSSDEHSQFPWRELSHPNMAVWVAMPRSDLHYDADGFLGLGYSPGTAEYAAGWLGWERDLDFSFIGQVTHSRREIAYEAMTRIPRPAKLVPTHGFAQGPSRAEYLETMIRSKVVPCPGGPGTPDTFRLWEALEMGCLPIADARGVEGPSGYWEMVTGLVDPPFPVLEDWNQLPSVMSEALANWPANANRGSAWWQRRKRDLAYDLDMEVERLAAGTFLRRHEPVVDDVTVLIPTSVTPSAPDTAILEQTVASVMERLPGCEIFVMVDGLRAEQFERRADFDEYTRRVLRLTQRWPNVVPFLAPEHWHQGAMTRRILPAVRTSCVLFVEHDTPLCGDVPFADLVRVIQSRRAKVIRLHHEVQVLAPHRHLMLDHDPVDVEGVPMLRTIQWSQRPHLALTSYYASILKQHFGLTSRTMIEDVMHGVVQDDHARRGEAGWREHGLWLYAPEGDMKRSWHLDGRGGDTKYPMIFAPGDR